jgi:hypothetical protein
MGMDKESEELIPYVFLNSVTENFSLVLYSIDSITFDIRKC